MKKTVEFYEVRTIDDMYGLEILHNESAEKALEEINRSYENAKKWGYNNRENIWIIVCNQIVKEFNENGVFVKEEHTRFVIEQAEFSEYENAFVFVY